MLSVLVLNGETPPKKGAKHQGIDHYLIPVEYSYFFPKDSGTCIRKMRLGSSTCSPKESEISNLDLSLELLVKKISLQKLQAQ